MKVNSNNNRDIAFNGFYNSKALKKGLEFAADNGALFAATTTLALSSCARPLAILAAPHTDKENKKVACAKSISSSLGEFALTFLISAPIVKAIKRIDKNPKAYLKNDTINNLKEASEKLTDSKAYSFATQLFKLGLGLAVAAPKAILTTFGMPYVMQYLFHQPPTQQPQKSTGGTNIVFKGKKSNLSSGIGKVLNNKKVQEFSKKHKDSNFPMHIVAIKDSITTATFMYTAHKSKKIQEERKPAVIYNTFISTGLSITSSYVIDRQLEKPTQKFIERFKKANKNDPKLNKYLEGIRIAKPILIIGGIYYILIPFISTFLADIADRQRLRTLDKNNKRNNQQTSSRKDSKGINISPQS